MKSPMLITKAIELNVLVLYTGMSKMLFAHSLYCDMSQPIVLIAFGNVSGLKSYKHLSFVLQFAAGFHVFYIKVAFLIRSLQCATRSKGQILAHYTKYKKNTTCSL